MALLSSIKSSLSSIKSAASSLLKLSSQLRATKKSEEVAKKAAEKLYGAQLARGVVSPPPVTSITSRVPKTGQTTIGGTALQDTSGRLFQAAVSGTSAPSVTSTPRASRSVTSNIRPSTSSRASRSSGSAATSSRVSTTSQTILPPTSPTTSSLPASTSGFTPPSPTTSISTPQLAFQVPTLNLQAPATALAPEEEKEEKRRLEDLRKQQAEVLVTPLPEQQATLPQPSSALEQVRSMVKQVQVPPMPQPVLPSGPLTLEGIQMGLGQLKEFLLKQTSELPAETAASIQGLLNNYANILSQKLAQQKAQQPIPEVPVRDTPPQLEWLNQWEPIKRQDWRVWMDNERNNLGLPQLEAQRIDLLQTIQASIETYKNIVKDIRENPELPTGLARRRIEDFTRTHAEILNSLQEQLKIVEQQIDDANSQLNRLLGIAEREEERKEREILRRQKFVTDLIEGGAFTEITLSDEDLKLISERTDLPVEVLRALNEKAKKAAEKLTNIHTQIDDLGNITIWGLDKNQKPQIVGRLPGIAKTKKRELGTTERRVLADLLAQVPSYKSREEALADLERYAPSIRFRVGESGLQKIREEIDRLLPPSSSQEPSKTASSRAGGVFGVVSSFFKRLFSR